MKCKYCNAELDKDAQFCTSCGKDLSKFDRCMKCGELIDKNDLFCTNCGTEKMHVVEEEEVYEEVQQQQQQYDDEEESSSRKWLIGIVALLLLSAAGYFIYHSMNSNDNSKTVELKPFTTEVSGENGELISVVDGTYQLIINNNSDSEDAYAISIKLKLEEKLKDIDDVNLDDIHIDDCELLIMDQNGGDIQTLRIDKDDEVQLKKLLKSGINKEKEIVFKGSCDSQEFAELLKRNANSFKVKKFHVTTALKTPAPESRQIEASQPSTIGSSAVHTFSGQVDEYPVTMEIVIDGTMVSGSYYYNRKGSHNRLMLSGTNENGYLDLNETDANGTPTGHFRGTYSDGIFQGQFITGQGNSMSFYLERI